MLLFWLPVSQWLSNSLTGETTSLTTGPSSPSQFSLPRQEWAGGESCYFPCMLLLSYKSIANCIRLPSYNLPLALLQDDSGISILRSNGCHHRVIVIVPQPNGTLSEGKFPNTMTKGYGYKFHNHLGLNEGTSSPIIWQTVKAVSFPATILYMVQGLGCPFPNHLALGTGASSSAIWHSVKEPVCQLPGTG